MGRSPKHTLNMDWGLSMIFCLPNYSIHTVNQFNDKLRFTSSLFEIHQTDVQWHIVIPILQKESNLFFIVWNGLLNFKIAPAEASAVLTGQKR